jgi:predicted molibdopterin-dependent oxidoreductase YjgC
LSNIADVHLNHKPGTDVALLNGMMLQIVKEGLYDKAFVNARCEDFNPFLKSLNQYDLKTVEGITGVSSDKIRQSARLFGKGKNAIIMYGMGITQHTTGTDNVKAIAGQNNVQGACDLGALPNVYPGYQKVNDHTVRRKFQKAWGRKLDDKPGLTLTDMFQVSHEGRLKAMYIVGENPMMSEPDLMHARSAMIRLEFLAVQDLFLTETAQLADVVLPAASFAEKDGTFTNTERRVQRVRKAIKPLAEAKGDWEIVANIATKMGYPLNYSSSSDIMDEIAKLTPIYSGISYNRLNNNHGLQWPCWSKKHPGTPILHKDKFTRGRGKFHAIDYTPPAETPSFEYPLMLTTGRVLEHWHTGSMSHRSHVLEALAPESCVEINPADAAQLGIVEGDLITLSSRRGMVQTKVKKTPRVSPGLAFMAFHWGDAPANVLTNPVVDPVAKIPEFKVSSIKAILSVLEKAAKDNAFLAALAENPIKALDSYNLTAEQRAALAAGDIVSIEKWVGPLEERLKVWLKARLAQEKW